MAVVTGDAALSGGGTATLANVNVGWHSEAEYFTADNSATLTAAVTHSASAAFSSTTLAAITLAADGQFSAGQPYQMVGIGGGISVPPAGTFGSPVGTKWLQYQAPFAGSMAMSITSPTGLGVVYSVYDVDGDLLQSDPDGQLGLVLFGADFAKISISAAGTDWVDADLTDTLFYTDSSGVPWGKLNSSGHIVTNTNWPDFSFSATPLILDGTSTYEIEATFAAASIAASKTEIDVLASASETQADYVPSVNIAYAAGSTSAVTTLTLTPAVYGATYAAGKTHILFESDRDGELVSLRWRRLDTSLDSGFTLTWSYAARASSALICQPERPDVLETPGAISLNISNGYPSDTVVFSIIGPTTILDFQAAQLTWAGVLEDYAIMLPALLPGNYVLNCEAVGSGAEDVSFRVLNPPLTNGALDISDPTPPVVTVQHWTFYDVRNANEYWTLLRNPSAWTNMHPPNDFTHENTTAPDGQILTWEAGARPWRMEFRGYLDDKAEYERFVFWSEKRRRLWLIDHRNRAWLVTLEHFDAQARIEPNKPWAHDYSVRALIFKQGTD